MTEKKTERLEMRVSEEFLRSVDNWRRQHPDLPPRAEAIRELIALGLEAGAYRNMARKLLKVVNHSAVTGITNREHMDAAIEIAGYVDAGVDKGDMLDLSLCQSITMYDPIIRASHQGVVYTPCVNENGEYELQIAIEPEGMKSVFTDKLHEIPSWLARGANLKMSAQDDLDERFFEFYAVSVEWFPF